MCLPSFLPCAQAGGDALYQGQEDFKREIAILRACRDPNIVAFLVSGWNATLEGAECNTHGAKTLWPSWWVGGCGCEGGVTS